jgi:hypothetical protein
LVETEEVALIHLLKGCCQLGFLLGRQTEGLIGPARNDGDQRSLGESYAFEDDLAVDDGAGSDLHGVEFTSEPPRTVPGAA